MGQQVAELPEVAGEHLQEEAGLLLQVVGLVVKRVAQLV